MARSIGVFCTECRTKRINSSQCRSSKFTFQLSGNRQTGLLTKEVVIINDRTGFILLQIIEVLRCYLEHLSGTFTVRSRDDRCMEIDETFLMEKSMDSYRHVMTNAEHCTKSIRTGTQVSNLTQKLQCMAFLLQRICIITSSQNFNFTSLNLSFLAGTYRFRQFTIHAQTSTGSNVFQHLFIKVCQIYHNLHIIYCRTVIQGDKINLFTTSAGTNPAFHVDHSAKIFALQYVNNLCSTNLFHKFVLNLYYIITQKSPCAGSLLPVRSNSAIRHDASPS